MASSRLSMIVGLVAVLAATATGSLVVDEARKLAETVGEMEQVFPNTIKQIFWANKVSAESLMKSGREVEGKELLNTAQIAAFIESIKYAIRHKSLSVVKEAISERFVEEGSVLLDKQAEVNIRPEMLSALVARVNLRAYADCDRYTAFYWASLYKLIEHNLAAYPENRVFKILAINAYQQLMQLSIDTKKAVGEFERVLAASLAAMDIDKIQGPHIVALLDQMIDRMLDCEACAYASPDPARHNTRSMFDGESDIQEAVSEHVDENLQDAFVELDGVYDVHPNEQKRVTRADIERLMQQLIDGL